MPLNVRKIQNFATTARKIGHTISECQKRPTYRTPRALRTSGDTLFSPSTSVRASGAHNYQPYLTLEAAQQMIQANLAAAFTSMGLSDRYKAKLVALGNQQDYRVDYGETFASVAKMTTIQLLLALAASESWLLLQMEVKNAFLRGNLPRPFTCPSTWP
ncbi:hypothetical protein RJ639_035475 [Escallonia herrerae]|uniref:Reverse transcriptase Ty1/copia-type domain-containing protein n=1 Tax=Escallonia herrerae TaxID=1293975 RepID=A0AA89B9K1_9ASTE|nr:hypothetical protein RJ639_035475 [Escallonia herrerae]